MSDENTIHVPPQQGLVGADGQPLTSEEAPEINWAEEVDDFMERLPEALENMLGGEKPILNTVYQLVTTLFDGAKVEEDFMYPVALGFGAGALAAMLSTRPEMAQNPGVTKDVATHYAASMLIQLVRSNQMTNENPDEGSEETPPEETPSEETTEDTTEEVSES